MHRTQLLLETWQMEALRARAQRRSISISELVREIVSHYLATKENGANKLYRLEGIGDDRASYARDHDVFLYGKKQKR